MLASRCNSLLAILGVLLIRSVAGDHGPCADSGWCRDMDTEAEVMQCLQACRSDLSYSVSDETPVYPGNAHMQPLSEDIQKYVMSHFRWDKFGKSNDNGSKGDKADLDHKGEELHVGRGSLAAVVPASSQDHGSWEEDLGSDLESLERQEGKRSYAMEHFRWGKPVGRKRRPIKVYPNGVEEESAESYPQEFRRDLSWETDYPESDSVSDEGHPGETKKDNAQYKMHHFRWNAPSPKRKRYGGFMTSERSHTPLVTLFKNAMVKTPYKKGQ
ncbi:pro-opiomelanocortin [Sceloporus undulatus]|uniref:pro-opiomelanocortin n=1 Tax=Sceloporus undulatus TaxID=8520 RepID=UPI001C4C1669|nr:pro-opiomelanocortin [Sceloporus undulatus]